ncbi:MAG: DegQ family serine endoprotease [Gammaproteobacteria bacterium]|nr:DegQ family serine endoprotease [Gammaproteobacteria bacterium]MBU0785415.1 DegQ family serine endoprotease [Gammaproteobacteria bacterium]MBU0813616.1 DegQ family serine endoprotease [Gammaproteobacteria bacterium]MBU1788913.1 DegQ family serine endoprotease [Gammaproteobacteria bacterium]
MNMQSMTPTRLVLALVTAGVIGGAGASFITGTHARASAFTPTAATPALVQTGTVAMPDFSQITERYGASVVNISVSGIKQAANDSDEAPAVQRRGSPGQGFDDPFFEFFRRFQVPGQGMPGQEEVPTRGQGSGFIVSTDGLILTNAHVVQGATDVSVKLTDRREFQAKVLGSDPKTDVAVLKIEAKNLPVVPMGSVRDLKVGEWVLAIGSPFGFENSVSAGVVSAKGRSLPDDSFVPFIQTDVAVNPGNSGGPLFNARGEVVGINSQIYSRTGGYQGLSFAIPIDVAIKVKDQIVATGHASHARLGVAIQEVNQTLADSFKLDKPEGALVSSVDPGGPADKAGLKTGDVILNVNGKPVVASGDLPAVIGDATPGAKVTLGIWRQGKAQELTAQLGDASEKVSQLAQRDEAVGKGKLGLALRPLQPDERAQASVAGGLLVEQAAGPAAKAGIQPGDVLLAVNGTQVKSVEQVRALLAKSDKSVALLIQRDGSKIFVPVRMG